MEKTALRVLFIGDICGRPGREVLRDNLSRIKEEKKIDLCIANIENAAHGKGVTRKTYDEVAQAGVDAFTSGNHVFRMDEIFEYLEDPSKNLIRPANYPEDVVGFGEMILDLGSKGRFLVVSLIGRQGFNENTTDAFRKADEILEKYSEEDLSGILVDFHGEVTSEKVTIGHYLDGRVSAVVGTHTHVPTADERILPKGTAHISDVGMVGPQNSSLWVRYEDAIQFMKYPYSTRFEIEEDGPVRLDAVIIDIMGRNKAKSIERLNLIFER